MKDSIILVTNNGLGNADITLQQKLAVKYFELLSENNELPSAICFYTEGVKLTMMDSPALTQLKVLESMGVRIIICSTCLDYYGIKDKVQIGIIGGMPDIIEAQTKASKVITI